MHKQELVGLVAKEFPQMPKIAVENMCDMIFNSIIKKLQNGGRVELRYFGTFFLRHYPTRMSRNPRTGEAVEVLAKSTPRFRPGRRLLEKASSRSRNA